MSRAAEDPLPSERFEKLLLAAAPAFALELTPETVAGTAAYLESLDSWRRRANLTGALSAAELAEHALESLLGGGLIPQRASVADIGSGAGFPGIPLAISRPDLSVALVEPRHKRAAFLRHVARTLPLPNVVVHEARVEDLGGHVFDSVATRAVGALPDWLGDGSLVRPGGSLLAWTTEADTLAGTLLPRFRFESALPIPGSRRRQIAVFRRV
jgi:16S rRNA (guanine527-N7)-methyltransferase